MNPRLSDGRRARGLVQIKARAAITATDSRACVTSPQKLADCTWLLLLLICLVGSTSAAGGDQTDGRWGELRRGLFQDRQIFEEAGIIAIEAPERAIDPARVSVTLRAFPTENADSYIRSLWLVVDNNPVPVAAAITFEPGIVWDTLDTEIRVNEYSEVRAIAEMSDGELHMASDFVKASGGCSAPPSSYEFSDESLFGTYRGNVERLFNRKLPALARFQLIHPNASGMQFDQFTRTYIPAHFVHTITARFDDKLLFSVDTNFSLSQDPTLGFNFKPEKSGRLTIRAVDSKDKVFEQSWDVEASG